MIHKLRQMHHEEKKETVKSDHPDTKKQLGYQKT